MKTWKTPAILLALALASPATPAQDSAEYGLVVRHDPQLIRLHESLVGALLSERRCLEVQEKALGAVGALAFEAWVRPLDIPQNASRPFEQPPGVFAALLRISWQGKNLTTEQRDAIVAELGTALRADLEARLVAAPRKRLHQENDALHQSLQRSREEWLTRNEELAALPSLYATNTREQLAALERDRRSLELDLATEESGLELLQARTATAAAEMEGAQAREQELNAQLSDLGARVFTLREELDEATATGAKPEKLNALLARYEEAQQRFNDLQVERERRAATSAQRTQRVQQFAADSDAATVALQRLRTRLEALREQIGVKQAELKQARVVDRERAELKLEVDALERGMASLRDRAGELNERLARLGGIEVDLWR